MGTRGQQKQKTISCHLHAGNFQILLFRAALSRQGEKWQARTLPSACRPGTTERSHPWISPPFHSAFFNVFTEKCFLIIWTKQSEDWRNWVLQKWRTCPGFKGKLAGEPRCPTPAPALFLLHPKLHLTGQKPRDVTGAAEQQQTRSYDLRWVSSLTFSG